MGFLLFFISLSFSLVYYFFYLASIGKGFFLDNTNNSIILESIFQNQLIWVFTFFIIGIFFLFTFSSYSFRLKSKNKIIKIDKKNKLDYKKIIISKILSSSYYLSYIFFYLSIFLISKYFDFIDFSYFIFIANVFVLLFFVSFKKLFFSGKFLRINQVIFSFVYIISYLIIFFTDNNFFIFIDFVNSIIIVASFILSFYFDSSLKKDNFFIANFLIYIYFFIIFYLNYIFTDTIIFLSAVNIIISLFLIELSFYKKIFNNYKTIVRGFGLTLGYSGALISYYYLFIIGFNFILYMSLTVFIIYNFFFHKNFQNYISFLFSILTFGILLFFFSFGNIGGLYNFIFILFYSYFILISTYFFDKTYDFDYIFLHFISYFYNLLGIIFFLFFYDLNFLNLSILMFLEFLYFFMSYYKLNTKKIKK